MQTASHGSWFQRSWCETATALLVLYLGLVTEQTKFIFAWSDLSLQITSTKSHFPSDGGKKKGLGCLWAYFFNKNCPNLTGYISSTSCARLGLILFKVLLNKLVFSPKQVWLKSILMLRTDVKDVMSSPCHLSPMFFLCPGVLDSFFFFFSIMSSLFLEYSLNHGYWLLYVVIQMVQFHWVLHIEMLKFGLWTDDPYFYTGSPSSPSISQWIKDFFYLSQMATGYFLFY